MESGAWKSDDFQWEHNATEEDMDEEGKVAVGKNEPEIEHWEVVEDDKTPQDETSLDPVLLQAISATAKSKEEREFYISMLSQVDVNSLMSQIQSQQQEHTEMNLFDFDGDEEILMSGQDWQGNWVDVEFEVALDSGAIVHVCHEDDAPGYMLQESAGSKRKQHFTVGDGGRLPNQGEKKLNLGAPRADGTGDICSVFQIAKVTRPLMSVGKICDQGMKALFDSKNAIITDQDNNEVCRFERVNGGLYTAKMKLKAPFAGQSS